MLKETLNVNVSGSGSCGAIIAHSKAALEKSWQILNLVGHET